MVSLQSFYINLLDSHPLTSRNNFLTTKHKHGQSINKKFICTGRHQPLPYWKQTISLCMSWLLWIDSSNEIQQAHRIRWCHNNMQAAGEGMIPYLQADWCWPWSWCALDADYDVDVSLMLIMMLMWAWCWSWCWCELDADHDLDVSLMPIMMMWAWCWSWCWCDLDLDLDVSLMLIMILMLAWCWSWSWC